jgi:hypothetical protein
MGQMRELVPGIRGCGRVHGDTTRDFALGQLVSGSGTIAIAWRIAAHIAIDWFSTYN